MNSIDLAAKLISRTMKLLAAIALFMLSLFILADVLARGLLGTPLAGVKEMIANSIVLIAFLQLPYTIRIGGMLRAEILDENLPPVLLITLKRLSYLLGALLFALIAYSSFQPMLGALASGEYEGEGFRVPTSPVRVVIVFGAALGALNFLLLAIRGETVD